MNKYEAHKLAKRTYNNIVLTENMIVCKECAIAWASLHGKDHSIWINERKGPFLTLMQGNLQYLWCEPRILECIHGDHI